MDRTRADRPVEEIAAVVRQARPRLQALFRSHRCTPEDAEDIVQEALLVMVKRWAEIAEPEAFLFGVVRRQILNLLRRRRNHKEVSVEESMLATLATTAAEQTQAECRHDVATLLATLPERSSRIVELRYGEELSSREIAEELSYSVGSVRKLAIRHLERLRREADKLGFRR
jgi:RNA polymerase sigma factor (sigma-70 family)